MQEIGLDMVSNMSFWHSLPVSKSQVRAQGLTMALSVLQFVLAQAKEKQRALALWEVLQTHTSRLGKVLSQNSMSCCMYQALVTKIVDFGSHGQNHEQATGPTRTSTFYHGWLPVAPHKLPIKLKLCSPLHIDKKFLFGQLCVELGAA